MRVALVNNLYVDQLGYYYISAVLKQAGHDVEFFTADRKLADNLKAFKPQLVGLTAVTGNHQWAVSTAALIKEWLPETKTILGGPHPTYFTDILQHSGLDFICRGEGETAILSLVNALEGKQEVSGIPGIWAKLDGEIFETPFADLIEDLDSIPFPDRSIYDKFALTKRNLFPLMLTSRGCPYQCTFCYAPTLNKLTKGKGKFVRFRSVDNVIAEASQVTGSYNVKSIEIVDDIFGMHKPWLRDFAKRWPKEVGVGFQANLRADLVNEETVDLFQQAGCRAVAFGLESGNERVRNNILQKEVKTESIRQATRLLKQAGIKVITYNILGSPTETFDDALDTLKLNQQIKPDYAWASVMQPYPGTKIHDIAIEHGHYDQDDVNEVSPSFFDTSVMKIDRRRELTNLQKWFQVAVQFPVLTPVILQLIKLPENALFNFIFLTNHVWWLWLRIKKVPSSFLAHIVLNAQEMRRRHKSGLYKREMPMRSDAPDLKQQLETGAVG